MDGMSPEYGMTDPAKMNAVATVPRHRAGVHAWMGGIHNISELELDRKFGKPCAGARSSGHAVGLLFLIVLEYP